MTTIQNWTDEAGTRHTRLIDADGTITTWDDHGQLCREGCGEPAEAGENGRCRYCAGTEEEAS